MKDDKRVLRLEIHWDSLLERTLASFLGGLLAGGVLYTLIQVF